MCKKLLQHHKFLTFCRWGCSVAHSQWPAGGWQRHSVLPAVPKIQCLWSHHCCFAAVSLTTGFLSNLQKREHITIFCYSNFMSNSRVFQMWNTDLILTKRWQCYDSWYFVWEFGVIKHTGDIVPLIHCSREEDRACLCVWVCAGLSLQLSISVQSQGDVSVGSPSRWNARDHPELTSFSLYHLCFNGHIWPYCKAGRKARRVILSHGLMFFPAN